MASRDGRSVALVGATILLIVAAANIGYGVYRVMGGHAFELPLMTGAAVCAGLAAILFSRAGKPKP
ncbi:hypothetical protein IP78_11320 [Brevundimonas sp. AAP58]|uniref:hypothetical protein n=1 Tax=Brevundimonas sp. AAP58 TaxID=1523422 RepID=UPI0006B9321E|nr:hypothetical protein [Brevundimonas sp. AAP58]KPF78380.1 hypothetical protein IP78_11320 [Brevundimonas sp. AAP58]